MAENNLMDLENLTSKHLFDEITGTTSIQNRGAKQRRWLQNYFLRLSGPVLYPPLVGLPQGVCETLPKDPLLLLRPSPTVRGVAMNPVDHPHGGGEGRSKSSGSLGRVSQTPWGKPTKGGYKTGPLKRRK
jgi:hypothetical protein